MRIALVGYGAMGRLLAETIERREDLEYAGAVSPQTAAEAGAEAGERKLYKSLDEIPGKIDAVIDFSRPASLAMIHDFVLRKPAALVMATTGYTKEQEQEIQELGKTVPVVRSSNFSLGVIVLKKVIEQIAPVLKDSFDMELIEKHHNKKADAPSGTAKMLLAAADPQDSASKVYGRCGESKRQKGEIGVHAVRGGSIVGDHTVLFAGEDEVLEFTHRAGSKQIFASGAVRAAVFASQAAPGYYDMEDVLFGS